MQHLLQVIFEKKDHTKGIVEIRKISSQTLEKNNAITLNSL